jgi:hypothetical protein
MRTTKSHKNIEKAMRLHALLRKVEKLAREIKPLRAHFRDLLDKNDLVLVAGRLAVVGKKRDRTKIDRVRLAERLGAEFDQFCKDDSYIEIDVKPAIQLAQRHAATEVEEESH